MIRITFLLRRHPDMDRDAFYRYWRETHGPLVASHARHINALKYVQVHTIADDALNASLPGARGAMEPPYDGVAEVWFENREALADALSSAEGQAAAAALVEDEARFIDLPNSPLWLAVEHPQVNPTPEILVARERSSLIKAYYPLRCHPGQDLAEAQRYWYTNHGPIIRRQAAGSGILRYVQVHRIVGDELEEALRAARGTTVEPYMGHAELWYDRVDLQLSTPEREAAARRAIEDEAKFIDFQRSTLWLAKEHVFVDYL